MKLSLPSLGRYVQKQVLSALQSTGRWTGSVVEVFTGAWQRGAARVDRDSVLSYFAVYGCVSLIAGDISKMRMKLMTAEQANIFVETKHKRYSRLLAKPNHFQTPMKFLEAWVVSKLLHGNAYVLLERDELGDVVAMYVLDPRRVTPLVSPMGEIFYQLAKDNLSGLQEDSVVVPATEIIHDTGLCLFHPLIGVSPIFACGLAAQQGVNIQQNSTAFFENMSRPSGVLVAPTAISDSTAQRLKEKWDQNHGAGKMGGVAVLGDGLKYVPMSMSAADSQMIEQLKMSAEVVCACFHVPSYKINVGTMPSASNVEALDMQYYSQCLQVHIEGIEAKLREGLGMRDWHAVELDLDALLRMDTANRFRTWGEAIKAGFMAPNEARARESMLPKAGGDTPYMQQQNYSLAALDERDRQSPLVPKPPAPPAPAPEPTPAPAPTPDDEELGEASIRELLSKGAALYEQV